MIFSVIILLLVAVITYFHYVQGFFSATISAIIAILSAVVAVSYHETIAISVLKGKMGDDAEAVALCAVFGLLYIILRIIFDKAVPGNLRFPAAVDAVGGAVMGLIAGIFATGVFAIAAESLPFGPSIGGYTRYAVKDKRDVVIPTDRQQQDSAIYDELAEESSAPATFIPAQEKSLIIPVDDIVLGTVAHLSDNGALAGARSFASIHPNYPQELFGDRLGIQVGGKHTAVNADSDMATLDKIFIVPALSAADPEFSLVRDARKIPAVIRPKQNEELLVARITINHNAGDDADSLFRFSTGAIRLVANNKNYYPIGTVDKGSILFLQKLDDFILVDTKGGDAPIDVAFVVDKADLLQGGSAGPAKAGADTIADGVFLEVKRMARMDLSGKQLESSYSAPSASPILRKKAVIEKLNITPVSSASPAEATVKPKKAKGGAKSGAGATASAAGPTAIAAASAKVASQINYKIGVTTTDDNAQNLTVAGGVVSLKDSKLAVVTIDPTVTLDKLGAGDNQLSELFVPEGKKLVQISTSGPVSDFAATLGTIKLVDSSGTEISPNGFFTLVGGNLFMRYTADQPAAAATPSGTPGVVTYLFVVPTGTELKQVNANAQQTPVTLKAE